MNFVDLARKLKLTPNELRDALPGLGFDIGRKAIKVDDRVAVQIIQKWKEYEKQRGRSAFGAAFKGVREQGVAFEAKEIVLPKVLTVREFSEKLRLPVARVMAELMNNGILASINEKIDFDTASIIAGDLGYKVAAEASGAEKNVDALSFEEKMKSIVGEENAGELQPRPPVVVVMGHVDHGKTKLLDAIRETNVVAGEAGGITQHIGAYQTEMKERLITFIDTPGHEAFTAMRSRGARVADIAVLVVAADDGIQPQTREVIKIINAAKLPFIFAINKIDKPDINLDKIKTQLSDEGLTPEEWGGKTICVPLSAKTKVGVDALLEMILLVADMNKDKIAANPARLAAGSIIESHIDKGEGAVATVLVQTGTLRRNDHLAIGVYLFGRVRAMKNWRGENMETALPGTPVKILGFKVAPQVGDIFEVPKNPNALPRKTHAATVGQAELGTTLLQPQDSSERKEFHIILKTDVLGSLEALIASLQKMEGAEVAPEIIQKGLGNITEADVNRALDTGAQIFGFNVFATPAADLLAREKGVKIRTYKIIYDLLDAVHDELEKLLPKQVERNDLGKLKVLAIFRTEKDEQIIGGVVIDGTIAKDAKIDLVRGTEIIAAPKLQELQCGKQEVKEAGMGRECGIKVKTKEKIQVNDVLHFYSEKQTIRIL